MSNLFNRCRRNADKAFRHGGALKTALIALFLMIGFISQAQPLKVVVVGMTHDHVHGILNYYREKRVDIVAIVEPNQSLVARYKKQYKLPDNLFFTDLNKVLKEKRPAAVLAFNAIDEHLAVVEAALPLRIPVMVEKPLATTVKDALHMAELAEKNQTPVLTNYETTWYQSNHWVKKAVDKGELGAIRKMVVHSGHEGPREIGCSEEFLAWLTDPVKNGGGASRDFGCYGANLMTWLMKGEKPKSVTAIIQQYKPNVYPKVDDVATILLEYETATGVIEASWNWPYSIKDMEVFGANSYVHALNDNELIRKKQQMKPEQWKASGEYYADYISYLEAYLKGEIRDENDLSSLKNNLLVVKILEAATRSAKEGRKVSLD